MNSPYNGKFRVSQKFKGAAHDGLDLVGIDSKEVHSTVHGKVERAGWENAANHSQGFGQYVRIVKDGTAERYYYGHLSKVCVKVGDRVRIGQLIGIEGSTGHSTGSHCHYCARNNGSKSEILDINAISGVPNNEGGIYDDGYRPKTEAPAPTPPAQETGYSVGDRVEYSSCYRSSTDDISKAIILKANKQGVITRIYAGTHNPYLIGNGTCFVNDGDIRRKL